MAKISIPCFVAKKTVRGTAFYWQPSATLKAAGWTALPLGLDFSIATAAAHARNAEIDQRC